MSSEDDEKTVESDFKVPSIVPSSKPKNGVIALDDTKASVAFEDRTSPLPDPLTTLLPPDGVFRLEVMKSGNIIGEIDVNSARISFGRSRECDVPLDHPSISRFHAVILWKESPANEMGFFYLIDLNSTHGSSINKESIPQGSIIKLDVNNNVIKFGGSSRVFMLSSRIPLDEDEESLNNQEVGQKSEVHKPKDDTCSWGMAELPNPADLKDEAGEPVSILARILSLMNTPQLGPTKNEGAYSDNPLKTMQTWFDREGYEFEYKANLNNGKYKCSLELPIEGQDVSLESEAHTKVNYKNVFLS